MLHQNQFAFKSIRLINAEYKVFHSCEVSYIELNEQQREERPSRLTMSTSAVFCGSYSMSIITQRTSLETLFCGTLWHSFYRLASLSQVIRLHEGHTTMQTLTYQLKSDLWSKERRVTRSLHAEAETVNKLNWIEHMKQLCPHVRSAIFCVYLHLCEWLLRMCMGRLTHALAFSHYFSACSPSNHCPQIACSWFESLPRKSSAHGNLSILVLS